jgi:hypothetical protein
MVDLQSYQPNLFKVEERDREELFSKRIRAGKRTYFFDVKSTRSLDYYITITESKRSKFDDGNFVKMKIHLYKEDFNKFSDGLAETIGHVKTTLLPEYNFDEYDRQDDDYAS